jgi:hypothetical protein
MSEKGWRFLGVGKELGEIKEISMLQKSRWVIIGYDF